MDQSDQLEAAFRPLSGPDLFRGNIFRLSGLSPRASTAEVRRRRDEVNAAVMLQAPVPPGPVPGPAVGPDPTPQALQMAFGLLRDPRARLVHELLWVWSEDGDELATEHDALIVEHAALLGETWADARPAIPDASANKRWRSVLGAWSVLLDRDALWERMHRRATGQGDNRAVAVVRRLRERVQAHLLCVNAAIAAHLAPNAPDAATEHTTMLRDLPFPADLVSRVLRGQSGQPEDRITALTGPAVDRVDRAPGAGPIEAVNLLAWTARPLQTVAALRGWVDPTTAALHDTVAEAVRTIAVLHVNHSELQEALRAANPPRRLSLDDVLQGQARQRSLAEQLLGRALELAHDPLLRDRIGSDITVVRSAISASAPSRFGFAVHSRHPLPSAHPDPTEADCSGSVPDAAGHSTPQAPTRPPHERPPRPERRATPRPEAPARGTGLPTPAGPTAPPQPRAPSAAERARRQQERRLGERERFEAGKRVREERLRAEKADREAAHRQRHQEPFEERWRLHEAEQAATADRGHHGDARVPRSGWDADLEAAEAEARQEAAAERAAPGSPGPPVDRPSRPSSWLRHSDDEDEG